MAVGVIIQSIFDMVGEVFEMDLKSCGFYDPSNIIDGEFGLT